jgi:hypothetical protein
LHLVQAVPETDLLYAQNASPGQIFSIPQSGGASTPFGNTTNNCLPIGLIPAAKLGGVVVTCWDDHSLQIIPFPQGGLAVNYTQLPGSCNPEQDLLAPDGNIYVACDVSNDFVKVSATSPHPVSTIVNLGTSDNCQRPQGVIVDASNPSRFIVSCFSSDKLVSVAGTAVSDYASMPSGCGPVGMVFAQSGDLFTVCNSGTMYRNTFAGGSAQQATLYANIPTTCVPWGVALLNAGPYPGDLVVSCRGDGGGLYRVPNTALTPASALPFSADSYAHLANFVSAIIDTTPPTFSNGNILSAFNVGTSSLTLVWNAAEDDVAVTGYRLYQGPALIANLTSDATVYDVAGLQPGTSYTFTVQAGDAAGNWGNNGPSVTITTASQTSPILAYIPWIALILGAVGSAVSFFLMLGKPRLQRA